MRRIAIVALVALAAACASSGGVRPGEAGPCASAAYQDLQSRPVDDLSEREYQRLRELERACADHQVVREEQRANQSRANMAKVFGVFAMVGVVVIAVIAGSI